MKKKMINVRRMVNEIAYTPLCCRKTSLSAPQLSLIPLLAFASSLYSFILTIRHHLYRLRLLPTHQLGVPVVSVGNLSWGGNGKTPMVDFIANSFLHSGISPLILTRGYGCGDEARMLQRHFHGTSARIGVGANRAATAALFLNQFGCLDFQSLFNSSKIGVAILDDGMQHLSLRRDMDIVMINGMMPWGNGELLPLGPLREPLTALRRADIVVVHHADLILKEEIKVIESTIRENNKVVPIYYAKMAPSYFFSAGKVSCKLPLVAIQNQIVLCVSAIGSADSFVRSIEKVEPTYVDRLDFSDHHVFQSEDAEKIMMRLQKLSMKFGSKPIVILTEKDYDRDPNFLSALDPYDVLVLCSKLQIVSHGDFTDEHFKKCLQQLVKAFYLKESKQNTLTTER